MSLIAVSTFAPQRNGFYVPRKRSTSGKAFSSLGSTSSPKWNRSLSRM